jgi:hypothetical protein
MAGGRVTGSIKRGLRWSTRLTVTGAASAYFPTGVLIRSQVRATEYSPTALATLTTENGGITRVSDDAIDLVMTAVQTAEFGIGTVVLDFLRMDSAFPVDYGIKIRVKVDQGITSPT